jgi:hypothetical protein
MTKLIVAFQNFANAPKNGNITQLMSKKKTVGFQSLNTATQKLHNVKNQPHAWLLRCPFKTGHYASSIPYTHILVQVSIKFVEYHTTELRGFLKSENKNKL